MARAALILGGARSGKSRRGEEMALSCGLAPVHIATAEARDDEMRERIARHKARRRGRGWREVEAPLDLAGAIRAEAAADRILLVDCLTLWLANTMLAGRDAGPEAAALRRAIGDAPGRIVLVSSEVGLGIVPENALARRFRDLAGELHRDLAREAETVLFMVAGLPLAVKAPPPARPPD